MTDRRRLRYGKPPNSQHSRDKFEYTYKKKLEKQNSKKQMGPRTAHKLIHQAAHLGNTESQPSTEVVKSSNGTKDNIRLLQKS